ncbi:MAG TPA: EAL domain-containing protein, partial [Gammaproteobacteria bacterium]
LALLATVFIAIGFIFFQRTVLQPFSQLTRAMKAIAKGEPHAQLPRVNSIEAGDLVEAFAHMRRTVHERQLALRHQALHDTLTGLPNRTLFRDRLQQTILAAERGQHAGFCLLMLDLDRFKEINDTLGHAAGDEVLCEIGTRLSGLLRKSDTVARLGGDEFAILLPEMRLRQAQEIAQLIADTVERPLFYQDRDLPVGVSIGIAVYPDHGRDAETLFKHSDVAMYVAKQNGLAYAVYSVQQDQHSLGRLALISELRGAIAGDELMLHYQPKLDMADGTMLGVEALLRWPKWSAIPTEYLIRTAEKTSLIKPLTQWVLQSAIRQIAHWRARGIEIPVAVNLSTWNLAHSDIDVTVHTLLQEHGVPAELLELEITEHAMMQNPERAHEILDRLAALGVRLSVDDYGTGFSSLAYLKNMPVDHIKIDKSFVSDMLVDENDAVIVRSTIDLAHNLGMRVVAEGVTDAEIWDLLEMLGCDAAQGYFIAHPMSATALEHWLCSDMRNEVRQHGRRA